jgi:tetratricopeptide (TPR) repeat protein
MTSRATPLRPALGAVSSNMNRLLVSVYKVIGFAVLTAILFGIVSYVGTHVFYLVHRSWVVPTVISANDPVVLDLRARIAHEDWMRHKLLGERANIEVQLKKARRVAELESSFQKQFRRAMAADAAQRRRNLKALGRVRAEQAQLRREIRQASVALEGQSRAELAADYAAKLIDKQALTAETYQLAQLAQARLNLSQNSAELDAKMAQLAGEVAVFEKARDSFADKEEPLNYQGLSLLREHETSVVQALGAGDEIAALERGLDEMDQAVVHYDEILKSLEEAPLLRATQARLTLAFVPYENESQIGEGAPVYACRLGVLVCRRVGRVRAYWEGEVKQAHPVFGRELRGQLAELVLDDPMWSKADVLHVNRAPLLF